MAESDNQAELVIYAITPRINQAPIAAHSDFAPPAD